MAFIDELDEPHENLTLEFKWAQHAIPEDLWETYSAFANTEGGEIVLGIQEHDLNGEKQYRITGVDDPDHLIKEFWDQARDPNKTPQDILPADAVSSMNINGATVVIINVPKANRNDKPVEVYDAKSHRMVAYVRRGESDYRASSAELDRMHYDRNPRADTTPIDELGIDALDQRTIAAYRQRFNRLRETSPWTTEGDEDFLFHVNALGLGNDRRMHPTQAGLLAFGQEHWIHAFFANYHLDYQENLDSSLRWSDRLHSGTGDWSGNLIDFYYEVAARLDRALAQPFGLVDNGMGHTTRSALNDAVHEAVVNALVHAYYSVGSQVRVLIDSGSLTVMNSGTFLIDRKVAIAGGVSQWRNPTLAKIFTLVGIVDRAGSGLQAIYQTWQKHFDAEPVIEETYTPDEVRITLPIINVTGIKTNHRRVASDEILALCHDRGQISADDLVEVFGMKRQAASVALRRLAKSGRMLAERDGQSFVYRTESTSF